MEVAPANPSPLAPVAEGRDFLRNLNGNLWLWKALRETSWEFPVPGGIHSNSASHEGMVFFGCDGRHPLRLDSGDRREAWKFDSGGISRSSLVNGVLYFGTRRKSLPFD